MNMTEVVQAIRGGLIQQDRLLKASIPALPENALVPRRAVTYSELGRDFSVTLDMVSTAGDIELKTLIAQPMTLWIQQANKSYRPLNGYIHTARRLGADGGLSSYQLTFASWMHFLKFRSDMRYWQDESVDAIITDVFNAHPQARGQFEFALLKPLPPRSYCRQSETDWNFVHRLLEEEGLFGFWRQDNDGKSHRLVVTDDVYSLDEMFPNSVGFSRSGARGETDAFTQWAGSRTLQSTVHTTRTFDYKAPSSLANPKGTTLPTMSGQGSLPDQAEVYEYTGAYTYLDRNRGEHLSKIHLEEWESRAKRFSGVGGVRAIDAGCRFVLTGHPEHDRDPVGQREFAAIKVHRYIENNLPLSNHEATFPYSLQGELAQAKLGQAGGVVTHDDGSAGFYRVEVEAQRVTVPYRSPFEHKKPAMELETAIVVGPQGEEVYTDALNRVKVMFVWDRQNSGDASASCWVRVAQSDTGGGYGSVHVPRVGEEVLVGYVGGDCDRPIVLHRVYNGNVQPQWHSNGILSGYRSKEYSGAGYNEMVLDDATGQNRARLFSSNGNSLLHLGYLIDQSGNARGSYLGSGFDLKTDSYGAVRAARGLYVTTHPKQANSQQLDVREAQQQLVGAESMIEAMSQASQAHQAESLADGHAALKAFTNATQGSAQGTQSGGRTGGGGAGNANAFQTPVMLLASPSGVALSTQQSVHVSSDQQTNLVSGQGMFIASGKSLVASVAEKISLFVQNAGMKLFAAKGKVEIQAQGDQMAFAALKDLTISSTDGKVVISAAKEVWIGAGGSYIQINGSGIVNGSPGTILERAASWDVPGPDSVRMPLPPMPIPQSAGPYSLRFDLSGALADGEILGNAPYTIKVGEDSHYYGTLDQDGMTGRVFTEKEEAVHVSIRHGDWTHHLDTVHDDLFSDGDGVQG
ncbi:type VI secretion system tip protein VgrG [Burkholderia sp. JP2-270]|uniref:type VI secretion system Vgr family protein n=1 Tax=Burkholderia sp. JP2-270 TaxID=2217913 RepID=UPI000DA39D91|nr:type VI secretion system Vgr family protein [Burkholderia sp. JP2-270]AWV02252.1 type VI secretion system tip protein VgrG [Burkholderia sp. JP2-270]